MSRWTHILFGVILIAAIQTALAEPQNNVATIWPGRISLRTGNTAPNSHKHISLSNARSCAS